MISIPVICVEIAIGGEASARLVPHLRIGVSADTILRIMRRTSLAAPPTPRVLGVDDWARRKGHTYGTLLVDLERHCPVDLLPDREAASLAAWLKAHPGVEIICRDRFTDYAKGAAEGAPDAVQVADRWHLLKNLGEAIQKLLERHAADLRATAHYLSEQEATSSAQPEPATDSPQPPDADAPTYREALFAEVKSLGAQGYSQRAIAARLKLHRETVARYLRLDCYTRCRSPQQVSAAAPFWDYLQRRWQAGCRCSKTLWREIQAQGYSGSYVSVWRILRPLRAADNRRTKPPKSIAPTLSARKAMWLLVKAPQQLSVEEQRQLIALRHCCSVAARVYPLAQRFVQIVRVGQADELDGWLQEAQASSLKHLAAFADGLQRDYAAVRAALSYEWSNGQTEGQVNRLKCIKRQMYGRAKFDLLRLRVLYPT